MYMYMYVCIHTLSFTSIHKEIHTILTYSSFTFSSITRELLCLEIRRGRQLIFSAGSN